MNSHHWLQKAETLRMVLARLQSHTAATRTAIDEREALERMAIAQWLREEFSQEPPQDTQTLPLFETSQA